MKENPQFLDDKYKDLTGSKPVERAVEQAKNDPERKFAPHTRDERIQAYLNRLDRIVEDERGWELLKFKILKEFTIDTDDEETLTKIAYSLYESEKRIAIEQGRGGDVQRFEAQEDVLSHYRSAIVEKQEIQDRTLSGWLDYLHQNDAQYPTWFRYFVVRNLEKMGTLNKEKGEYGKRTDYTIAPFPELNSEALGFVYRMLTTGIGHQEFADDPDKKKKLLDLIEKKDFTKLYVFAQLETSGELNRESLQGEWVKYNKGSNHHILEEALRGKGTGWCTAEGSAYGQLQGGDFYIFFTKGKSGTYSEPRIAIRMAGNQVAEVRGVNHRQELEPLLVDVAQEKYHSLPGGGKFDKKSEDMKQMTALVKKQEENIPFTKDDLLFLYEVNGTIEGFGYEKDPRIEELRKRRNRKEDITTIINCDPAHIATDFANLKEDTQVYVEDKGTTFRYLDFREAKHREKLPRLLHLAENIRETGSPARPDISFEGGIVHVDITPEMKEKLKDFESAKQAFKEADNGSPSYPVWEEWKKVYTINSLKESNLNIVILSYNKDHNTRKSSEKILADMEKLELRPLTLEEMIIAGIYEPKFTKTPNKYFVGLTKYALGGDSRVPVLNWCGGRRGLYRDWFDCGWFDFNRFLCVRK